MKNKLSKNDYKKIARAYIVALLEQMEGVFTDKYFNSNIENKVNNAINDETKTIINKLRKSTKYEIYKYSLDDIIDEYLSLKFKESNVKKQ